MDRKDGLPRLIEAARELHKRTLWQRFENADCFGLRLPGEGELMVASVMGGGGEQFGLSLFRGPNAVEVFVELTTCEAPDSDLYDAMDLVGLSMDPFGEMPPHVQAYFREAGIHPKQRDLLPTPLIKPPHRQPRLPDDGELAMMLAAIKATVWADRRELLHPATADDPSGVCVIDVEGEPTDPAVSVTREPLPQPGAIAQPSVFAGSGADFTGFKRAGEAHWVVGTPSLPLGVADDDRSMQALLVIDLISGKVLEGLPFFADELRSAVDQLTETLEREGMPASIAFASRNLHDALRPPLEKAGVRCGFEPGHPAVDEVTNAFLEHMESGFGFPGGDDEAEDGDPEAVPAPDDLAGWKKVDERLTRRFIDYLHEGDRPHGPRAVKRYFGDEEIDYYFETYRDCGVLHCYTSWCVLEYRPTRKSRTQAELMLEAGLPEPEAMLLRAKMRAVPSVYRVKAYDPEAGTIEVDDVLRGGEATIHDQLLSENIDHGVLMPARVCEAGRFGFLEMIGPPLPPGLGFEAVEFLRSAKLAFTDEGLKREAHKFGWLWDWLDERESDAGRPHLCNTDGEDMVLHTASFAMTDAAAVAGALRRRADIDHDERAGEYVWTKPNDTKRIIGDDITLGRIELLDDELVLTVNSAERYERARQWIEGLPGVSFIDVRTRDPNADDFAEAPDDRTPTVEPSDLPPELVGQLQAEFERHYMAWLDRPVPALGDKTPRQACETAEGRAQVATLIRTMPDPVGPATIEVPRRAMLRALGLPTGSIASSDPQALLAPETNASTPAPKVGRNAPCPCGSGLKYKKCCGA